MGKSKSRGMGKNNQTTTKIVKIMFFYMKPYDFAAIIMKFKL